MKTGSPVLVKSAASARIATRNRETPVLRRSSQLGTHMANRGGESQPQSEKFAITTSRGFAPWLAESGSALAVSAYQSGKLIFIGASQKHELSVFERSIDRPMALHVQDDSLFVSTLFQLWKFDDVTKGERYQEYDRLYSPRSSWVTGDLDIHDVKSDQNGRIVFVNTLFSCLATTSEDSSFAPLWRPPFITKLVAEDRCHLNGLAIRDGKPAFVTAVAATDAADAWREHRVGGGVIIDVESGEVVASGLSMPHAPRCRDGKIWLQNAGTGEFGFVEPQSGIFQPIAFCPGFLRGLCFLDGYAIATMSLPRALRTFEGLPLQDRLDRANAAPRCGIAVISLSTGGLEHWLRIEGVVAELFDVVVLPDVTRPALVGFRSDEVRRVISVGEASSL